VNLRRTFASGAAGIAAIAMLTACGFNYPTDRPYEVNSAANYRDGTVEILNAAVVAKAPNAGTFVATLVNGSTTDTVSLQSVSGDNTAIGQVASPPLTLAPNALKNLATEGGFAVDGTFGLGQFVNLTFQFDNGESASMSVPVVGDDGQWEGLDTAAPSPSQSPSQSPGQSPGAETSPPATESTQSPSASSS
jgi:hypothetical protein